MLPLVKRLEKGSELTYEEMDGNLDAIRMELETKVTIANSSMAIINAIMNLRDGVGVEGDTLNKLLNLIKTLQLNKLDISIIESTLTSTDKTKVLSADQGKILKDLIDLETQNRITSGDIGTTILSDALTVETNARIAAILQEAQQRILAITQEGVNRDNAIATAINNEVINRNAAIDASLQAFKATLYSHG